MHGWSLARTQHMEPLHEATSPSRQRNLRKLFILIFTHAYPHPHTQQRRKNFYTYIYTYMHGHTYTMGLVDCFATYNRKKLKHKNFLK